MYYNQWNSTRLNSFVNFKSALVDASWQIYDASSMIVKSILSYKQTADAILTEDDVKNGYYHSISKWLVKQEWEYEEWENIFDYICSKDKVLK